jgi:hypothetical protein
MVSVLEPWHHAGVCVSERRYPVCRFQRADLTGRADDAAAKLAGLQSVAATAALNTSFSSQTFCQWSHFGQFCSVRIGDMQDEPDKPQQWRMSLRDLLLMTAGLSVSLGIFKLCALSATTFLSTIVAITWLSLFLAADTAATKWFIMIATFFVIGGVALFSRFH